MDFDAFSERAREVVAAIPAEFLEGIESVETHREAMPDPYLDGVMILGECVPSALGPEDESELRSTVHLYHGSFRELARRDPSFDVEHELVETIHHEVQHHIEDRAGRAALRREDDLFEAHARFRMGEDMPPGWYRLGERLAPRLWAVDLDLFLELEVPRRRWDALRGTSIEIEVLGGPVPLDVPADAEPDEIWTLEGAGLAEEEPGEDEDEEEQEEEPPGPRGDLHVIPVVR